MKKLTSRQQELSKGKLLYRLVKLLARQEWLRISDEERSEIHEMVSLIEILNPLNTGRINQPIVLLYYFNTLALCQYMLHSISSGLVYSQKILYLWKMNPDLINPHASLFLNSLKTTSYHDLLSGDISQLKENLDLYKLLAHLYLKNEADRRHFDVILFNTVLKLFHHAGEYDKIDMLLEARAEELTRYAEQDLSPSDGMPIVGTACISYFVMEKWDRAERLMQRLKGMNKGIEQLDVLYFTSLFYPVILYEKKDKAALKRTINGSLRDLRTRKLLRSFERELLVFLKELAEADTTKIATLISLFLKKLDRYDEEEKALYFLYFDYYGWLECKRTDLHYRDYKKDKREPG